MNRHVLTLAAVAALLVALFSPAPPGPTATAGGKGKEGGGKEGTGKEGKPGEGKESGGKKDDGEKTLFD